MTRISWLLVTLALMLSLPVGPGQVWAQTDTTPPTIIGTDPADGSHDMDVFHQVKATFSEDMDPNSIHPRSFFVVNQDVPENDWDYEVYGNVEYSTASHTARFTPVGDLYYNTRYTATITTEVRDLAGNHMVVDYKWTFVTRDFFGNTGSGGGGCFIQTGRH